MKKLKKEKDFLRRWNNKLNNLNLVRNFNTQGKDDTPVTYNTSSDHTLDLNKIMNIAKSAKITDTRPIITNTLSKEIINKTMNEVMSKLSLDNIELAYIFVAGLMQKGGSNQKAGNSIHFSFQGKSLSSQEFNKILNNVHKGATNRQFARSIGTDIVNVALAFELPGDLHSQMKLDEPNLTLQESVWCSNFQTQNPDCPDSVRHWLVDNYKDRFNR